MQIALKDESLEAACGPRNLGETLDALRTAVEGHLSKPDSLTSQVAAASAALRAYGFSAVAPVPSERIDGGGIRIFASPQLHARLALVRGEACFALAHPDRPEDWYCVSDLAGISALGKLEPAARAIVEKAAAYRDLLAAPDRLHAAGVTPFHDARDGLAPPSRRGRC